MAEPANCGALVDNMRSAVAAELTTLPTYLYPYWSIKPATDGGSSAGQTARASIMSVVLEEMLHMGLSSNLLNALGGTPFFNEAPYLPAFPGFLLRSLKKPTGWGPPVDLLPLSSDGMDMLIAIELPEWDAANPDDPTLAEFYDDCVTALLPTGDDAFEGGKQLASWDNPGAGRLFAISSRQDADAAITEILDQGEGLSKENHDDGDHELAHYWRFAQIKGWLGDGTIHLARDVYPVVASPSKYLPYYNDGQIAANAQFNSVYSHLLDALQATLMTDEPDVYPIATGLMDKLGQKAAVLRQQGMVAGTRSVAGPTFDYVPVADRAEN